MRHWRIFIYLIFLNILFNCVENAIRLKGRKSKVKIKGLTKPLNIPKLPDPEKQSFEQNINEAFTDINILCDSLLKKKGKKQKLTFKQKFISTILKYKNKDLNNEIKLCCIKFKKEKDPNSCNNLIENMDKYYKNNKIYKEIEEENGGNEENEGKRVKRSIRKKIKNLWNWQFIRKKIREMILKLREFKLFNKITNSLAIRDNKALIPSNNHNRKKRGAKLEIFKKYSKIFGLSVIGIFCGKYAIILLIGGLTISGFTALAPIAGGVFLSMLTIFCIVTIRKWLKEKNKIKKNNFEQIGHHGHLKYDQEISEETIYKTKRNLDGNYEVNVNKRSRTHYVYKKEEYDEEKAGENSESSSEEH